MVETRQTVPVPPRLAIVQQDLQKWPETAGTNLSWQSLCKMAEMLGLPLVTSLETLTLYYCIIVLFTVPLFRWISETKRRDWVLKETETFLHSCELLLVKKTIITRGDLLHITRHLEPLESVVTPVPMGELRGKAELKFSSAQLP